MNSGDFIYIDFVGRVKDTGEIFDLTREDVARQEKIYDPKFKYHPVAVIVGAGFVLKGLDDALKEMKVGEKRTIEIPPEKAFGERRVDFIKLIPLHVFKEQDVNPVVGDYLSVNGIRGKVISINGGRVRVDFNHPLAGKKLEYEVEIKKEITNLIEKVKAIVNYYTGLDFEEIEVEQKDGGIEIKIRKRMDMPSLIKENIAKTITKWIKDIKTIMFVDVYPK